jgi:membrane protease YdiL (CAAX protease family)
LKPLPKYAGIVIITILWYTWHLNFGLSASHFVFFGILLFGSWGIGIVADKTRSFLAVAAFHSLNNFFKEYHTKEVVILISLFTIWILCIVFQNKIDNFVKKIVRDKNNQT